MRWRLNKLHQYSIVFSILGILLQRLRNSLSLSANSNSNSRHLFIYISRRYRHVSWLEDDGMESSLSIFHFTKRWKVSESALSLSDKKISPVKNLVKKRKENDIGELKSLQFSGPKMHYTFFLLLEYKQARYTFSVKSQHS